MSIKKVAIASVACLSLIAGFEGYREFAYTPVPGDKMTIGFGHTGNVKPGDTVNLAQAVRMLEMDVRFAENAVNRHVKIELTQNQFDALVSFVYNVGEANFASSTLLKCINAGDEPCVDKQWGRWKYFRGRVLAGLERRRAVELAIYRGNNVWWLNDKSICASGVGCVNADDLAVERPGGITDTAGTTEDTGGSSG